MGIFGIFRNKEKEIEQEQKLEASLEKTKTSFFSKITKALVGKSTVDDSFLDELEEILLSSDVGIETTVKIIDRLEKRVSREKYFNTDEVIGILKEEIIKMLSEHEGTMDVSFDFPENIKPYIIMVVGVNGVGKTTTIGKLAYQFRLMEKEVFVGAGDTFRAAAVDQLKIWGERAGVQVISRGMGSDPASVAYDTVKSAVTKNADVVILDTAGRLHNKINLMAELEKVDRVIKKVVPDAPHETVLILDASTGQNAIEQARQFIKATKVNTLAITKLDGTAKGGVILGIVDQFKIPVKYIGVGEKIEDLQLFDKRKFVESLFKTS
ncbi:MAG TPA: signal recognition particle-docking protein FtsY [Bacteroidia bacterium]|nr:signal recognition particle-docking protein FtsY [Sphingobacteriales bacterium]HPD65965.1 signal recognition particle-docking protein FtsY [Bacteroidia bacterium]HRS59614.1 signal recognition particle-docking protein FtsY [Bacteroidia bacterium]HRU68222.1 signal recognition particle-docking protein FtsY [Bacteroidia bacterium]